MRTPPPPGLQLTEVGGREICPLCREEFEPESKVWSCRSCQTRYHQSCRLELGGCSLIGCAGREESEPTPELESESRARVRPEFGHCSACGAMAHRDDLEECPECGAWRHGACASQIGCGNAECDYRPESAASPRVLQNRRWARQLYAVSTATGLAALVVGSRGEPLGMTLLGAISVLFLIAATQFQASSQASSTRAPKS